MRLGNRGSEPLPEKRAALARQRAREEVDLPGLVRLTGIPRAAGVLAVGSRSQGLATEHSDIDLLVLLEGRERIGSVLGPGVRRETSSLAGRFLFYHGDQRIDIETVRLQTLQPLERAMDQIAGCLEASSVERSLPDLQFGEMRFLTRLRAGHAVASADRIDRWRERFRVDLVPAYFCAVYFIMGLSHLDDAAGLARARRALPSMLAARVAAESIVLSALAYEGVPLVSLKFVPDHVQRLEAQTAIIAPVLRDLRGLLFPDVSQPTDYAQAVYQSAIDLHRHFAATGRQPSAVRLLAAYGRKRWALDVSFLDRS